MFLVPKDPSSGDLEWDKVFEVPSVKAWIEDRNKRMEQMRSNHRYWDLSEFEAQYCDGGGRLIKSFHACEKNPFRLV
jgi:hypothetical protein